MIAGTPVIVDVRDVAKAHILAATTPSAKGRYIISQRKPITPKLVSDTLQVGCIAHSLHTLLACIFCKIAIGLDVSLQQKLSITVDCEICKNKVNFAPACTLCCSRCCLYTKHTVGFC